MKKKTAKKPIIPKTVYLVSFNDILEKFINEPYDNIDGTRREWLAKFWFASRKDANDVCKQLNSAIRKILKEAK